MNATYKTKNDALAAGFTSCGPARLIERGVNGAEIRIVDRSGGNSYGYAYAISYWDGQNWQDTAHTVTVYMTDERNRANSLGAFATMFQPGEYERGLVAARRSAE